MREGPNKLEENLWNLYCEIYDLKNVVRFGKFDSKKLDEKLDNFYKRVNNYRQVGTLYGLSKEDLEGLDYAKKVLAETRNDLRLKEMIKNQPNNQYIAYSIELAGRGIRNASHYKSWIGTKEKETQGMIDKKTNKEIIATILFIIFIPVFILFLYPNITGKAVVGQSSYIGMALIALVVVLVILFRSKIFKKNPKV